MSPAESTIAIVNAKFEEIANTIEKAMRNEAETLLATHPEIRLICWCMGTPQIVAKHIEDWDGEDVEVEVSYPEFDGRKTPPHMDDFFAIAELDERLYNVITGRPRRYERQADGSIEQITEW